MPSVNEAPLVELPVYLRIARILEHEIARAYRSGDLLPSERILADDL